MLAAAAGWVLPAAAQERAPAGRQFEQAFRSLIQGDAARDAGDSATARDLYQKALADLRRLSKAYPDWDSGLTRFRIGYCEEQLRRLKEGPDGLSRLASGSRAGDPATAPARRAAADALLQGQTDEARAVLLDALKKSPDDPSVRLMLALVRCQQGRFRDAVFLLDQVVAESPADVNAHQVLGTAYVGLGKVDLATAEMAHAVELAPRDPFARRNLACVLLLADPPDAAAAREQYAASLTLGGDEDLELEAQISEMESKGSLGRRLKSLFRRDRDPGP